MDDLREKLVELIENANYQCDNRDCEEDAEGCAYHRYANCRAQFIADHLLANGVTVTGEPLTNCQQWIPVTERTPDLELVAANSEDIDLYACLVTVKSELARDGMYVGKAWYDGDRFIDKDCMDITYNVTHWMHLPELPKGE